VRNVRNAYVANADTSVERHRHRAHPVRRRQSHRRQLEKYEAVLSLVRAQLKHQTPEAALAIVAGDIPWFARPVVLAGIELRCLRILQAIPCVVLVLIAQLRSRAFRTLLAHLQHARDCRQSRQHHHAATSPFSPSPPLGQAAHWRRWFCVESLPSC